jgi:hypothetical protein
MHQVTVAASIGVMMRTDAVNTDETAPLVATGYRQVPWQFSIFISYRHIRIVMLIAGTARTDQKFVHHFS